MTETQAFILDPLRPEDAEDLHLMMKRNADRFMRFFSRTLSHNLHLQNSRAYISLKHAEAVIKKEFTWAIRSVAGSKVVGLIILREIDWEVGNGELSYCIDAAFEGKGWTSEAVQRICDLVRTEFELTSLHLIIHKSNSASIRVAEKTGFTWSKTLVNHYTPPGENALDMEVYEIKL